jgi:hypothetical protein
MTKKTKKLYKFLRTGLKSQNGDITWKVGEWYVEKEIDICNKGFHASKTPLQAMGYVAGEILAKVSVKGQSVIQDDKECWSEMKINKAWNWTKKDSVELSVFAAKLCLESFEKLYPDDKRPREAIEAARKVLIEDNEVNRSAARSAESAARSAARSAAESVAWSAAWSAESAAWSAESAESAAWSAESAESAESAAKRSLISKLDKWFMKKIKTLQKYE